VFLVYGTFSGTEAISTSHPGCDVLREECLQEYPEVFNWQEGHAASAEQHGRAGHQIALALAAIGLYR
jgi:hypothetical protein